MSLVDTRALEVGERLPGWKDRSFSTERMTFAHFTFTAGAAIHEHSHPNEEVWTVLEGELQVTVGGETLVASPGLVAIVPPNTAHSVRAVTDGRAIVTDSPVRVDRSGGRRGVVAVEFDTLVALPQNAAWGAMKIPFTLRNWGKTRVVVRGLKLEAAVAPALPPASTTDIPSGELNEYCVLEAGECRSELYSFAELNTRDLEDLRSGAAIFYLKGVVLYDDDFGGRQHRTFCVVYDREALGREGGFVAPARPGYNYGT